MGFRGLVGIGCRALRLNGVHCGPWASGLGSVVGLGFKVQGPRGFEPQAYWACVE